MRRWYKYQVTTAPPETKSGFAAHADEMGGYEPGPEYGSLEQLRAHYHDAAPERYRLYDAFLRRHLVPGTPVLSVASGRGVVELNLSRDGHEITCSDLGELACLSATRALWPPLRFRRVDMLTLDDTRRYAAIFGLSCLYFFSREELARVFRNFHQAILPGGQLIFDYGGAQDCLLTKLLDDGWLPLEAMLSSACHRLREEPVRFERVFHGYRISDTELRSMLADTGWRLAEVWTGDVETEMRYRSYLFRRWWKRHGWIARGLQWLGRSVPYVRRFRAFAE